MGCIPPQISPQPELADAEAEDKIAHELPTTKKRAANRRPSESISVLPFTITSTSHVSMPDLLMTLFSSDQHLNMEDEESNDHLLSMVRQIYPDSDIQEIKITPVDEGYLNALFIIAIDAQGDFCPDKILCRIFGVAGEFVTDRQEEETLFHELGAMGLGPKKLGVFGNGRLEEFFDGFHSVSNRERLHQRNMAKALAQVHIVHPTTLAHKRDAQFLNKMEKFYADAVSLEWDDPEQQARFEKFELATKQRDRIERFKNEILPPFLDANADEIEAFSVRDFARYFMYQTVFSHVDSHGGNILIDEDNNDIRLIDFEHSCYSYRATDFGTFFHRFIDNGFDGWCEKDEIVAFMRRYCLAFCVAAATQEDIVIDRRIHKVVLQRVEKIVRHPKDDSDRIEFLDECATIVVEMCMAMCLFWALMATVIMSHSHADYWGFIEGRLGEVFEFFEQQLGGQV